MNPKVSKIISTPDGERKLVIFPSTMMQKKLDLITNLVFGN